MSPNHTPFPDIVQDYWQLRVQQSNGSTTISLQGRRRTGEPFWAPLELAMESFDQFVQALGNAIFIIDVLRGVTNRPSPPKFPERESVAAYQGSCYWLEISETDCGRDAASVEIVVYDMRDHVRPALYLVDEELSLFHQDLQRIPRQLESTAVDKNSGHTNHPVESAAIAVRDAKQSTRRRVFPSADGRRDE